MQSLENCQGTQAFDNLVKPPFVQGYETFSVIQFQTQMGISHHQFGWGPSEIPNYYNEVTSLSPFTGIHNFSVLHEFDRPAAAEFVSMTY